MDTEVASSLGPEVLGRRVQPIVDYIIDVGEGAFDAIGELRLLWVRPAKIAFNYRLGFATQSPLFHLIYSILFFFLYEISLFSFCYFTEGV